MTQLTSRKNKHKITVSSPVLQRVEQIAIELNLSVAELLEQIGEGQLKVVADQTNSEKLSDRDIANTSLLLATKKGQLKADQTNSEKLSDRDIANTFIWLASKTDVEINVYKLQKLVYYAQAWHLGVYGIPLFDRDFQVINTCVSKGYPVACVIGGGYAEDLPSLVYRHSLLHRAAGKIYHKYKL